MKNNVDFQKLLTTLSQVVKKIGYDFACLLLFYKAYSDKWEKEFDDEKKKLIEVGWIEEEAVNEAASEYYHTFNFLPEYLWDNIRKDPHKILEKFSVAMKKLAELNPDLSDIFVQFDFYKFRDTESMKNLSESVELLSNISFKESSLDIVGDIYEWILKNYAPDKPKEGKLYTSRDAIKLMVELLNPKPGESIYDPAAGFAGMLIGAYKYLSLNYGDNEAKKTMLYGEEKDDNIYVLGKLNLMIHSIKNVELKKGDTLVNPKFMEENSIKKFDYVISNPPWNQKGYGENTLKEGMYWRERFKYGFTTKQSADWAWIQHMLASAKKKVVVVIDTGAVSRGKREKLIRRQIIEEDLLEAVVLVGEKIISKKSSAAIILVFNKQKPKERKGKILLINASKEFVPGKKQNTLSEENIRRIVEAYKEFRDIEKFTKVITIEEARQADYNLSPSRFVSIVEEEQYRSIGEIREDLKSLEVERKIIEEKLRVILNQLNG
jgi:type I restriction enzyme M protein